MTTMSSHGLWFDTQGFDDDSAAAIFGAIANA